MRPRPRPWLLLAALCGCDPSLLAVDVRTDLVPGIEFTTVVTDIAHPGGDVSQTFAVSRDSPFVSGARVAELELDGGGSFDVDVRLFSAAGELVVSRRTRVELSGPRVMTVVIARDCRDLECPGAADAPEATTCVGGRCARPECSDDRPDLCPVPECGSDGDCSATSECGQAICVLGACLEAPDDSLCGLAELCDPTTGCVDAPAPPECGLCGDTDGDGRISITDSIGILNFFAGRPVTAPCIESHGDVLEDEVISTRDALAILNSEFAGAAPGGLCEPCPRACGDVNGDGSVDAADATLVSEISAGSTSVDVCAMWAADVDDSRDIDVNDALRIQQLAMGVITALACAE